MATAKGQLPAFGLYPNPAQGEVVVELDAPLNRGEAIVRNALGQVVARQALTARRLRLDLPATPGLYLVTLTSPTGQATQKLEVR
jgi:hypothetical protein